MIKKLTTYPRPLPNNPMVVEDIGMDNKSLFDKINELVDAVNAMQNLWVEVAMVKKIILELQTHAENVQKRIDPPSAYEEMREKDDIIARHIGEKNQLREALETAKWYLMQIGHLNMSEHGLGSDRMMIDWCKAVALDGIRKIKPILEQKEDVDE